MTLKLEDLGVTQVRKTGNTLIYVNQFGFHQRKTIFHNKTDGSYINIDNTKYNVAYYIAPPP